MTADLRPPVTRAGHHHGIRAPLALLVSAVIVACSPATPTPSPASPSSSPTPPPAPAEWSTPEAGDSPSGRQGHTWTARPGDVAYLFGGYDGTDALSDLWAFDLAEGAWEELEPPEGPAPRSGHEAAWIDGYGLVVGFGRDAEDAPLDDLWAYDPDSNRWREFSVNGESPDARSDSCSVVGAQGRLWISHGRGREEQLGDTWEFDPTTSAWTDVTVPSPPAARDRHACWRSGESVALYAGRSGDVALDDLWLLEPPAAGTARAWRRVVLEPPPPTRQAPASAELATGGAVVLGGFGADGYLSDAYTFGVGDPRPQPLALTAGGPGARSDATMIHDATRKRLGLFGGRNADGPLGDLWLLGLP